jgi:hypothetical protein
MHMAPSFLSSNLANAIGCSLVLWSFSTTGRESQLTAVVGLACCSFAMGVLWAHRPWRNQ